MTSVTVRVARPALSLRVRRRTIGALVVLVGVVIGLAMLGLMIGSSAVLDPGAMLAALVQGGDSAEAFAVRSLRLPRVLAAAIVGCTLGLSGAIFQGISRNGLVSPDIIGVTSGASFAALVVIVLGTQDVGAGDSLEVPLTMIGPAALLGAFAASILVYGLAYRRGLSPYRLVLVGIGVTAVLGAGIAYALTLTRFPFATQLAFRWTVGSMYGVDWTEVGPALIVFAIVGITSLFVLRPLAALALGDDAASGLGARVERDRLRLVAVGVCLAALAVALAGPVGFVAFIAPHLARGITGTPGTATLVAAGAVGAALTMGSDIVAQRVLPGQELPLGAITAIIGAPYFLFLLYRTNRMGGGG